ncbi:hypothetical protein [Paractinoplanes brasiliensis]|uniref:Uncharacterized protein n=1 Tax=Paractinoplanes brasiliensis TaxID=52695 RepID=A0A4R6JSW1_9ACTN|nr:hypothetical protein [Actinoplanes brasiliensis]TDO38511.1 hypothetical protein C8E87_2168 [Actinoplanes brasiliensis]
MVIGLEGPELRVRALTGAYRALVGLPRTTTDPHLDEPSPVTDP